jgi:hypothetical protein
MGSKYQIDLKKVLWELDKNNKDFYLNLSDDEKKEMSLWVLMRYMSSSETNSEYYLLMTNDFVNVNFNVFKKHPDFLWKLLSMGGAGESTYHPWVAPPKGKKDDMLSTKLRELNRHWKQEDVNTFLLINSKDEIIGYFEDRGFTDDEIKKLFK